MIGTWDAQLKRLDHPLTGSHNWIDFKGVQITRKVWDGRANLDDSTWTARISRSRG
jgi:hypothetical protein